MSEFDKPQCSACHGVTGEQTIARIAKVFSKLLIEFLERINEAVFTPVPTRGLTSPTISAASPFGQRMMGTDPE